MTHFSEWSEGYKDGIREGRCHMCELVYEVLKMNKLDNTMEIFKHYSIFKEAFEELDKRHQGE